MLCFFFFLFLLRQGVRALEPAMASLEHGLTSDRQATAAVGSLLAQQAEAQRASRTRLEQRFEQRLAEHARALQLDSVAPRLAQVRSSACCVVGLICSP